MKDVKVLGPGCSRCAMTASLIEETAKRLGIEVRVDKVTDMAEIARLGIMSTPGVMIDGKVVHAGGLPKADDLKRWLSA